jgi:hypothetical protein
MRRLQCIASIEDAARESAFLAVLSNVSLTVWVGARNAFPFCTGEFDHEVAVFVVDLILCQACHPLDVNYC